MGHTGKGRVTPAYLLLGRGIKKTCSISCDSRPRVLVNMGITSRPVLSSSTPHTYVRIYFSTQWPRLHAQLKNPFRAKYFDQQKVRKLWLM